MTTAFDFTGHVVGVTGAAQGIGAAVIDATIDGGMAT